MVDSCVRNSNARPFDSTSPAHLIDQHGVSTLIHEGWLEDPSVTGFTRRRYDRYVELITAWATDIGTSPELVEMWLVQRWTARLNEARHGRYTAPTLF
ncbi:MULTISPECIES: 8-oxoguanine DNA glycosylase OGG fold protein [unclassified Rhodococcus (in: high G+C Gram-positive bacteria)]|uniref:8-oxoguanine DNA glycosylase OGG fold protein n=1 Tax=unclassified Rhodococcus (in: high G+C Gram-positive bacteria) TaxID=192944 RepID=UPI0035945AC6